MKYHIHFQHESRGPCEHGASLSPEHLFFCKLTRRTARKVADKRRTKEAIDWLLGSESGAFAYASK